MSVCECVNEGLNHLIRKHDHDDTIMNSKVNLIVLDTIVGCTHSFVYVIHNTTILSCFSSKGINRKMDRKAYINTLERNYTKLYKMITIFRTNISIQIPLI